MEKTNGIWSHKDGVLKYGSEIVANYIMDKLTVWDFMRRLELFDWVCKTLNEQEGLAKERLEKYLKDLKPIVNETHEKKPLVGYDGLTWPSTMDEYVWATEFCNKNIAFDRDTIMHWFANAILRGYHTARREDSKHEKGKQGIVNGLDGSKTAKLHLEKIVVDGKETFKLVGFENILRKDQLPKEYTEIAPFFYYDIELEQIIMSLSLNMFVLRFTIGHTIDLKYIKDFKACGDRLASINKKLKEVKPERFTVKI